MIKNINITPFQDHSFQNFYSPFPSLKPVLLKALTSARPLTIIGPPNSGKTHLMHALHLHAPSISTLSDSASLIKALGTAQSAQCFNQLRESLQAKSILLFDNIHQLIRSPNAQNFLLSTLTPQLTMLASTEPQHYTLLQPKLYDYLRGSTNVLLPQNTDSFEHNILDHYAKSLGVALSTDDLSTLKNTPLDTGAKKALVNLKHRKAMPIAQTVLLSSKGRPSQKFTAEQIIQAFIQAYALKREDICTSRPLKSHRLLQDLSIFLAQTHGTHTQTLCQAFTKKRALSIHHACQRASQALKHNPHTFEILKNVQKELTK